jgi:outer membrane protein TolC
VQRAQLEHAVALRVGRPAAGFSLPLSPQPPDPPTISVGLPSELLERRPDIAAAERRVAAANAQIGVAAAAFFPTLSLGTAGGYQSSSLDRLLDWPSRFWSVGPSLAAAVFNGGLRFANLEGTRAAYEASVATYRQSVLTAVKEVWRTTWRPCTSWRRRRACRARRWKRPDVR